MKPKKRKNPHAAALARLGSAKATAARRKIPPEKRKEIARKAAQARWAKKKGNK